VTAANLLHRVGTLRSQTVPSTPLSFGSPARDLTPQSIVSAVPDSEVFSSASEAVRQTSPDIASVTGSNDESTARSNDQQARGVSELWVDFLKYTLDMCYACLHCSV